MKLCYEGMHNEMLVLTMPREKIFTDKVMLHAFIIKLTLSSYSSSGSLYLTLCTSSIATGQLISY